MLAVDTNVLVRLLTLDDPGQWSRAAAIFDHEEIWIAKTVLTETFWVLQKLYDKSVADTLSGIQRLAGLPNVYLEDEGSVLEAFRYCVEGLAFDDAMHLASRGPADTFATFDRKLVQRAQRSGCAPVRLL
jgi:predicted nucleic-acid-binding protein